MTVYDIKPAFQGLLRPTCALMAKNGITPNQVTILALVLSFSTGSVVWAFGAARWTLFLVPGVLFIRMALNALDGMLAREHDMKTSLGTLLNELGDVASDTALYLPFVLIPGISGLLLVLTVILSILTEMTGVAAIQIGAKRRYDGPMGKSDRACAFGILALLVACGVPIGWWINVVLTVMMVLLMLTIVNRARKALKEVAL
jgi:CDP-diacylglycerol--glycerol-3-phosphate 3-phosphatidyltransferase